MIAIGRTDTKMDVQRAVTMYIRRKWIDISSVNRDSGYSMNRENGYAANRDDEWAANRDNVCSSIRDAVNIEYNGQYNPIYSIHLYLT